MSLVVADLLLTSEPAALVCLLQYITVLFLTLFTLFWYFVIKCYSNLIFPYELALTTSQIIKQFYFKIHIESVSKLQFILLEYIQCYIYLIE